MMLSAFHGRYEYTMHNGAFRSPLLNKASWHVPEPLDPAAMQVGYEPPSSSQGYEPPSFSPMWHT